MSTHRAGQADRERWLELRAALLPEVPLDRHDAHIGQVLASATRRAAFLHASGDARHADGLVEVVRDVDDGAVARLEALYVAPGARRVGVARALLDEAGGWAARAGCSELRCRWSALDESAHGALRALGFAEQNREVQFTRRLHPAIALAGDPTRARRPPAGVAPAQAHADDGGRSPRLLLHGLIMTAGVLSLLMTDIFSADLLRGALLPLVDVLFAVYLVVMVVGRQYRRRTDSSERSARLFQATPGTARRDRVE